VTLGALADELDISQQALSTRIRRGNERLLASVLDVS
jgi:predicted DNA binding protein